ncbi:uncharacterized protein LOC143065457 isoform X1 [Mytilus galloprovincialis]|uniref:uncharacterized protein LOC143065457 isoform X1 n=1 Tax=Mytilus galloprovincialis TaxID=29158 RepID=UPI003F7B5D05
MGCAPSSDTGTQYASLGHHGNTNVSRKTKTPTDSQLYGNTNKSRKSSISSSSSSSSDGSKKSKEVNQPNNVHPVPPPPVQLTENDKKQQQERKVITPPPPDPVPTPKEKEEAPPVLPPPPVEEKEERQPSPVPSPTPIEQEQERQPSPKPPPPQDDNDMRNPTDEDQQQVPPTPQQEEEKKITLPPPQEEQKQITPSAPPMPIPPDMNDETRNGGETIKPEKDNVDFDDTGNMETPAPPDFGRSEYIPTDVGTKERFIDFRTEGGEFTNPSRPSPNDNGLYTEFEFTVDVAVPSASGLQWQRPAEICQNPALFTDGTTRFDIGQGRVGTCWFLSMVANIADKPRLLERVVPARDYKIGTNDYDGVFHCRFWRFGHWSEIYIDDKLPTSGRGGLYGAHSNTDPNEMWVALLEKAFARMYGSYDEVSGGRTADAFMNLTAGVGETIKFETMKMSSQQLFRRLKNAFQSPTTMVGCVCPQKSDGQHGLVGGHAYSMNGTYQVGDNMLVRIRNPWGRQEWNGPWSDGSNEMSQYGGSIPHPNKDDGEFYMDVNHFLKYFEQCTICNLTPDVDRDGTADTLNYVTSLFGNWRRGKAGGFQSKLQNPQFCVTVSDQEADRDGNVPVVVQIVQKTSDRQDDKVGIRVDLYKVLHEDSDILVLDELGDKNNMYLIDFSSCYRFNVKPGKYVAVPSTMDSCDKDPRVLKEFLIRFFTAGPLTNPFEIQDSTTVMTGKGPDLEVDGSVLQLGCSQCITGKFVSGRNAGGQISCRDTFATNPQFFITINEPQSVKVEVMQPDQKNGFPIGIKLFETDRSSFQSDYNWFAQNYNNAVRDMSGNDGPFSYGTSVDCGYKLQPGTYVLLIHANGPEDQNDFAVAIYSERPVEIDSSNL